MTVERDKTDPGSRVDVQTPADTGAMAPISRRALLRGASAAVPTILTLHSGAALAQTSNLVGTVQYASQAIGENNAVQCLDYASAVGGTPAQLDLGDNPSLHVQYVPQRQYYLPTADGTGGDWTKPVSTEYVCQKGGTYWWRENGTTGKPIKLTSTTGVQNVNYGFMVSATALASFSADIDKKTYFI